VALTRRVSELGIGAASISVDAVLDAVDRFMPAEPGGRRDPTILRELARAATGMAIVTEQRALDAAEAVELTAQRAVAIGGQVPLVRDVLVGFGSFVARWSARADLEEARRRAVTIEFFSRLVPAVADAVIERVDIGAVVRRVPLADIIAAIDIDALLDQVDMNAILAHVDVDALLERIDVDGIVARVDISAMLDRVDMTSIVGEVLDEVDIGGIVRESTGSITGDAVDGARLTAMRLDGFVGRVADALLLRRTSDRAGLPPTSAEHPTPDELAPVGPAGDGGSAGPTDPVATAAPPVDGAA
jgi:hypothetical protein